MLMVGLSKPFWYSGLRVWLKEKEYEFRPKLALEQSRRKETEEKREKEVH
jgi:hypothetical protein